VTVSLDAELDALFQLPPAEMVEARNALVERLRKAGDKASAQQVRALKRPAPAAWALNQVHFHQPTLLDDAQAQAARVRALHAQERVDPEELWVLVGAQRAATYAVVEAALAHCASAGLPTAQVQQRKILATVQGWLSGAGQEPPGRMTSELEAAGFDAVAEVGSRAERAPVARPGSSRPVSARPSAPARDEQAIARARAALHDAERAWDGARESSLARAREHETAQAAWAKTKAELEDAERALSALRFQVKQRTDDVARSREAHEHAQRAQRAAEAERERAREALDKLEHQRG